MVQPSTKSRPPGLKASHLPVAKRMFALLFAPPLFPGEIASALRSHGSRWDRSAKSCLPPASRPSFLIASLIVEALQRAK
jgi:hypothetical protein